MKAKTILLAGISMVVLLLVCGAAILILSYVRIDSGGAQVRIGQVDRVSAEADQEWAFKADGVTMLDVESRFGNLEVVGGQGDEINITAHKTVWDSTQERAEAALEEMPIEVRQEGNKIIVRYLPPAQVLVVGEMRADTVDFTIHVPQECGVQAALTSGDIHLSGVNGAANLDNQFGDISVEDVQGGLQIKTSSGDVTVRRVQAGQAAITLESQFGDLRLEDASAGEASLEVNSGKVTVSALEVNGEIVIDSQFGDIEFTGGRAASLNAKSNSGKLILSGITLQGALTAESQFGDVDIEKVLAASYTLEANSGDITLVQAQGLVKAHTQFGRIEISQAQEVQLDLEANSGGIDFSGSLGEGPHRLKSQFGDVRMALPKNTALSFDLKTEFGKIKSAFQVTVSGELDQKHWVGTINGGGASLTVEVNSGNINLEFLSQ